MEHDLVLEGRVVTQAGLLEGEIGVDEGLISAVGHGLKGAKKIKTGRCIIFPGFVDIHVHLREPGWEHKEDFRTGSWAAVHGGVTTAVDMPNNPVPATTRSVIIQKRRLADEKAVVDVRLNGGVSALNLADIEGIKEYVVGYKLYLSETTGAAAFPLARLDSALDEIAKTTRPVSFHCESQAVIEEYRKRLESKEVAAVQKGLRPPEAEMEGVRAVVSALKGEPALKANICHASLGNTVNTVRREQAGKLNIFCEATLHHLYYEQRAMIGNPLLKTNPPLRSEQDRQALLEGLKEGTVSFLVTDHAPHTEEEKIARGAAGVPGLDDYGHIVSWLIKDQSIDPVLVAKFTSSNPSNFLGLDDRGELSPGKKADMTVLDLHYPQVVRGDELRTKCGWSPYEGREFPGRIRWTIRDGELLMDDFEMAD